MSEPQTKVDERFSSSEASPTEWAGAEERKAKNLAQNANCVLTTGCNLPPRRASTW